MKKDFRPNLGRLGLILFVFLILFSLLVMKLFKVQFIDAGKFIQADKKNIPIGVPIPATRGEIFDRNGYPLATNILKYNIGCEPRRITNKGWFAEAGNETVLPVMNATAQATTALLDIRVIDVKKNKGMATVLSEILDRDIDIIHRAIQGIRNQDSYEVLARKVDASTAEKLRRFRLTGVVVDAISQRNYPEGNLAINLIGSTGIDNQGLSGIESSFNTKLDGIEGKKIRPRYSAGSSGQSMTVKPAMDGMDLYLSIDTIIQFMAEEELAKSCEDWSAKSGCCIVYDVKTGEILAMAQYSKQVQENDSVKEKKPIREINRAIQFTFQPGSVLKGLVTAIALEENVINEDSRFSCSGTRKIDKYIFTCPLKAHGDQNLLEIIKNSCNLGFIQVGEKLGKDKFYDGLKRFGLGQIPNSGLGGEAGLFKKPKWKTDLPAMSYGTSLDVTPLQLTIAYSAIANGGMMMKPIIVRQEFNPNNGSSVKNKPTEEKRVISEETASRTMKLLTQNVFQEYGGNKQIVPGYNIAGKTGTAHMWDKVSKSYYKYRYNCSFIGVIPSDPEAERKLVIFTTVEFPDSKHGATWGSTVAMPCFKRLAPRIMSTLKIPKSAEIIK